MPKSTIRHNDDAPEENNEGNLATDAANSPLIEGAMPPDTIQRSEAANGSARPSARRKRASNSLRILTTNPQLTTPL